MSRFTLVTVLMAIALFAACGCGTPAPHPAISPSTANVVNQPSASPELDATPTLPRATPPLANLEPRRVEFKSEDGTRLVGVYWPPLRVPASGIVLMHMRGSSKESWTLFAALLQGASVSSQVLADASRPSYAVLTFDFRGQGESDGNANDDAGTIGDARSALNFIRSMPDVDAAHVVMVGASIGGDAAVDACDEGCVGAISLSPGGFLGIPYNDGLSKMGARPVLCVASDSDIASADTCRLGQSIRILDYQIQVYAGRAHGTDMFNIVDQAPFLTDFMFAWLRDHLPAG